MAEGRKGDVILAQGTYILVQDGSSGQVEVVVGPSKISLSETDRTVVYDGRKQTFATVSNPNDAIVTNPSASEGQYLVLSNPVADSGTKEHPAKGKSQSPALRVGEKINIPGPQTFSLFPGQTAEVVDGHQLKSNEYLLIRVYNEDAAKKFLGSAVIKTTAEATDETDKKNKKKANETTVIKEEEIVTGKLFIIKGTDVSFYIPPTGIEVLKASDGQYVRKAVTVERLEYCILLNENGNKRYVQGPQVVFPEPTESFISQGGSKVFRAIELNDNMGLYVKVIAEYEEGSKKYKTGEELFITGKAQKIYFPREEHSIIKYGDDLLHYAVALPEGEARYVLDKTTGKVNLKKGPSMFLPDPRKEVIVNRVLDEKTVKLWFPGNEAAANYNASLEGILKEEQEFASFSGEAATYSNMLSDSTTRSRSAGTSRKMAAKSRISFGELDTEIKRKANFTKPRTVTLDNKYDGAVAVNIWPGYAVQTITKTGERQVGLGPKNILLDYDQTLEVLELSTDKPKKDHILLKTVYLQTKNNIVSDIVTVETSDSVKVDIRLSYRVNFLENHKEKWFDVSNYIKLMTQHMRSVLRSAVKKVDIEEFNSNATDFVRDIILGNKEDDKERDGYTFNENGMHIYDVVVLDLVIGDSRIGQMITTAQHTTVEKNLRLAEQKKDLELTKEEEKINQEILNVKASTTELKFKLEMAKLEDAKTREEFELSANQDKQKQLNEIRESELGRERSHKELVMEFNEKESKLKIAEVKEKLEAIQPGLIEAMLTIGSHGTIDALARNLKPQTNGLGGLFGGGGIQEIFDTVKGTPLEDQLNGLFDQYNKLKSNRLNDGSDSGE